MGKLNRMGIAGLLGLLVSSLALPPLGTPQTLGKSSGGLSGSISGRHQTGRPHTIRKNGAAIRHQSTPRPYTGARQRSIAARPTPRQVGSYGKSPIGRNVRAKTTRHYTGGRGIGSDNNLKRMKAGIRSSRKYGERGGIRTEKKRNSFVYPGKSRRRIVDTGRRNTPRRHFAPYNGRDRNGRIFYQKHGKSRDHYRIKHGHKYKRDHRHVHHHRYYYTYLIYPAYFYYDLPRFYWDYYYPYMPVHGYAGYDYDSAATYRQDLEDYGLLRLFVYPEETEVLLDGEYLGLAVDLGERAFSVYAGEHTIELRLEGLSSYYTVYVSRGSTTFFGKDLTIGEPAEQGYEDPGDAGDGDYYPDDVDSGLLVLKVEPGEADIFLNDRRLGHAESLADAGIILPEGSHVIRIEAPGYQPYEENFEVSSAEPVELNVEMIEQI